MFLFFAGQLAKFSNIMEAKLDENQSLVDPMLICPCGAIVETKTKFNEHFATFHKDDASFAQTFGSTFVNCEICQTSFIHPELMAIHKLSHDEVGFALKKEEVSDEDDNLDNFDIDFPDTKVQLFEEFNDFKFIEPKRVIKPKSRMLRAVKPEANPQPLKKKHDKKRDTYYCSKCQYGTYNKAHFDTHVLNHELTETHGNVCKECNKTFATKHLALLHIKRIHFYTNTICTVCGKAVKNHLLKKHMQNVHNKGEGAPELMCSFCDFTGPSLTKHLKEKHPVPPKVVFPCGACTETFGDMLSLEIHQKQSHNPIEVCKICQVSVPIINLAGHLSAAHDIGFKERCEYCSFESTLCSLYKHVQDNHFDSERRSLKTCPNCNVKFVHFKLPNHIMLAHPDKVEKFICDDCGKVFDFEIFLKRHQSFNHPKQGFLSCHLCAKKVPRVRMNTHLSVHHDIGLTRKCKQCDFVSTLGNLKNHVLEHHNEKVECDVCHEVFRASVIRQHKRHAHIIGRIKCNYCESTCGSKSDLVKHIRNVHEREKNLKQCPHCDFTTVSKRSYKLHVDAHAGIKPHHCAICDYQTIEKRHLANHMKKKHAGGLDKHDQIV